MSHLSFSDFNAQNHLIEIVEYLKLNHVDETKPRIIIMPNHKGCFEFNLEFFVVWLIDSFIVLVPSSLKDPSLLDM